ncbi:MAG: cyclase family protein [Armatimonadota bacterium]|nr:cyclase family protein [bacterium]
MRHIIDLSHPITAGMPVYHGDPEVRCNMVGAIKDSGYNITELVMGTHTGTHMDAPRHCIHTDQGVDSLPLEAMIGWAEVLDVGEKLPCSEITSADLDVFADRVVEGSRVLIRTGWGKRFGSPEFFTDFPDLSEGAALWLTKRKIALLALEQPSVHRKNHVDVHKLLLSTGVVLIESAANMDQITQDRVYMVALPLRLAGLDGSPIRLIAIEGMSDSE